MSSQQYPFNANVPQAAQLIRATQLPIESNFQSINEWINVNHVGFSDATNFGQHTFLSLPSQGSNPSTSSSEMVVFCAPSTGANPYEIYYRYPSNGTIVQLTGTSGGPGVTTNGFSYLSDSLFIMWGTQSGIITGANTIVYPTTSGFPVFSSVPYGVYFTPATNSTNAYAQAYVSTPTTTQFVLQVPQSNFATSIYWLALGV